ncbi:hypothetical protein BDZ91DRAFT_791303 [Kalaharituber pfeilii]|nr:hypothetical protein BDZ91DRAFT_791303 [Kalaharituber pfeilii]
MAMLDVKMGIRHDYLEILGAERLPIIIAGRKYLGERRVESDKGDLPTIVSFANSVPYRQPSRESIFVGNLLIPGTQHDEILQLITEKTPEFWKTEDSVRILTAAEEDAFKHDLGSFELELARRAAHYFKDSDLKLDLERGVQILKIDDIEWKVNLTGVSELQKARLERIFREMRPWVATNILEIRHTNIIVLAYRRTLRFANRPGPFANRPIRKVRKWLESGNDRLGKTVGIRWLRRKTALLEEGKMTSSVVVYLEAATGVDRVRLGGKWLRTTQYEPDKRRK